VKKETAEKIIKINTEGYDKVADSFSQSRDYFWKEFHFLKNIVKNEDKILDIGCGNGRFLGFLKEDCNCEDCIEKKLNSFQYSGIDSSNELIKIAKEKYKDTLYAEFETGNATELPHEENSFNKIFSFAVIHHIPSKELQAKFMSEAYRVLKNDGVFVLSSWNLWGTKHRTLIYKNIIKKIFGLSKLDFKDIIIHYFGEGKGERFLHAFTKKELENLAKKAGFKIEKSEITKMQSGQRNYLIVCRKK